MRIRLVFLVLMIAFVTNVSAQWTIEPNPTLPGKAGIGVAHHSTARLRLAEGAGVLANGPFLLTFGSTTAMWWGFRFDGNNDLHLDRQDTGWSEGFIFKRNGNFGIGADPTDILHVSRDLNSGTILRVSNPNTGSTAYTSLAFNEGTGTTKAEIRSLGSGFAAPNANALHITNWASAPMFLRTSGTDRLRIAANGNVSINFNADHDARLLVQHGVDNSNALFLTHQNAVETTTTQHDGAMYVQVDQNVLPSIQNFGSVSGIRAFVNMTGTGNLSQLTGALLKTGTTAAGAVHEIFGLKLLSDKATGSTVNHGYGVHIGDVKATNDYAFFQDGLDDTNVFRGDVVIGPPIVAPDFVPNPDNALNVNGNAHFNGTVTGTNIKAHYQDVAEWVPATTDLAPGTVVILNRDRNNEVMASLGAYDTTVAGVVSAQPGLSLGVEGAGKEQIATTGRVKVRVDARARAILVGDLLVTGELPGTAMRSEPMSINGRMFHQPGTILGKALEPLQSGVGEILVLLSMQ